MQNTARRNARGAPAGMKQVAFLKGGQRFIFRWTPGDERLVYDAIHDMPELDDCDVAALMHQVLCAQKIQ